jgi:pimeloyl-ACP methyl ester carboxylesterase
MDDPVDFANLALGPYPDPLGYPGLAAAAMRRREIRGLRELFISQREIDDMGDPDLDDRGDAAVIRIVSRTAGDGIRLWVVQLPSTQTWHPRSGIAPNDITANLVIGAEREPTVTRAAIEAMTLAGIGAGEPVLLAGFSLGGMVAAQVAQRADELGFMVTHLVTAGAPLGRLAIPERIHVLAIEHVLDPVPRIEGRENPVWSSSAPNAPEWVTVKAGPPVPRGYRMAVAHHSPSYAETAGQIEESPPDERVARLLAGGPIGGRGVLEFFGPGQFLRDYAATRAGFSTPRAAVPLYLHSAVEDGITRGTLRSGLRRVPGVIAVDIYQSRTGFPTTIVWNADVLVRSLRPWFGTVERAIVYRGLLSLLKRRRAIGIHFRLQAKETPGVLWEATVQRVADGRWLEHIDVTFVTPEAEEEFMPVLLPDGWASTINYYPPDAFDPIRAL